MNKVREITCINQSCVSFPIYFIVKTKALIFHFSANIAKDQQTLKYMEPLKLNGCEGAIVNLYR